MAVPRIRAAALRPLLADLPAGDWARRTLGAHVASAGRDAVVPVATTDAAWDRLGRHFGPQVATTIAARLGPASYGLLTQMLARCGTVHQALRQLVRHYGVLSEGVVYRLEPGPNVARLHAALPRGGDPPAAAELFAVASVFGFLRGQATPGCSPVAVHVRQPPPPAQARRAVDRFFATAVEYGQRSTFVDLPHAVLSVGLRGADAELAEILDGAARDHCLRDSDDDDPTVADALAVLRAEPEQAPSLPAVAAAVGLSPRTLRRRLAAAGTSFRDLVDEVRGVLAQSLLAADGATVDQVGRRMGYADPSSFRRAFRRWVGVSPGSFARARTREPTRPGPVVTPREPWR